MKMILRNLLIVITTLHCLPKYITTKTTNYFNSNSDYLSKQYEIASDIILPTIANESYEIDEINRENGNNLTYYTELTDGRIRENQILYLKDSPYMVQEQIIIEKTAKLTIEPGVLMVFAPGIGITVEGILHAEGTPTSRITFTSQETEHFGDSSTRVKQQTLRLVDGPTAVEGRLQVYHKGSWRAICSNSRNWTQDDYHVACQQMGLQGGRFWNWLERSVVYKPRLLYERPNCKGNETSLFECDWSTRQLGSGACDYHSDLGIQCQAILTTPHKYWQGLNFYNSPTIKTLANDNTIYFIKSQSILKYINIKRAGVGQEQSLRGAIESFGMPPIIEDVFITEAAYTGVNVTKPNGNFLLRNLTVQNCNGIGVFINSSEGGVELSGCQINDNAADGIKYINHELRFDERPDRSNIYDFCTLPTTSGQTYPIVLSFNQKYYAGTVKECGKYFFTRVGYRLTIHIQQFILKTNESVLIEIFDGASANERRLFSWKVRNYTQPQSVTSTREKLYVRIRAEMREEVNGFIKITSGEVSAFDLLIKDSIVRNNNGRGIAVQGFLSRVHVHHSLITKSKHVAGIHIASGAGDVNITESIINLNKGAGINITYAGGNFNISRSTIHSNHGYGLAIWLNDTEDLSRQQFIALNQTTTIEYSQIYSNLDVGILHGNFCRPLWINITGNDFNNSRNNDIHLDSCWRLLVDKNPNLNVQIGHNVFENSHQNSIYLSPALSVRGRIEYNHFRYGKYGCIYIRNDYINPEFNLLPVQLLVQHNYFTRNSGVYVVSLGLSLYSNKQMQSLLFTRNFVRENRIIEFFGPVIADSEGNFGAGRLNPRCRVAAAVVVSSSNVDVYRNILHNLDSTYEIGSQLNDQSQTINATFNWLGYIEEMKIHARLFDRNDRYNLAKINYIPYLLHNSNPGSTTVISISTYVPRFYLDGSQYIGGEVDGQEVVPMGTYTVNKDINIRPGGKLTLQPGVTLLFEPSVGMMVAGKLEARGRRPGDILLTLKRNAIISMDTDVATDHENMDVEIVEMGTEAVVPPPLPEERSTPTVPVRLLGGEAPYEGRLQIYLNGTWGTVCDYGWSEINAALVCHHLGYTLNPKDWRLLRSQIPNAGINEDVLVSNIRCTIHDRDITKCPAEHLSRGEFENSCDHNSDVGMRCYEGAWAGVRFSMLAERADLQYITIEKAGLFDYTTNQFKPALQMDFARHNLDFVRIVDNLADGLGVVYADLYGGKSINNIKNSEFSGNRGSGITMKQLDFRIQGSFIKNNRDSGIIHDPVIAAADQFEIGGWFQMPVDFNYFETNYNPYRLPHDSGDISLANWESKYIRSEEVLDANIIRKIYVHCPAGYVLGIQLLNPIQTQSTENIIIYNSLTENQRAIVWNVRQDLNIFPATSSSYGITIYYESGNHALGGAVLLLSTVVAPVQNIRNKIVGGPIPSLSLRSTKIQNNRRGITAFYYNRYRGNDGEYYLRKANESIKIINSEISNNEEEAVFINSPYWDVQNNNLSEVTVQLNNTIITQNGYGIRQISKDLRSSNNLFHYILQDTTVENNRNGGFMVVLPYVWQYNENFTHSIYINNSTWMHNRNFGIEINGHYADIKMTSNTFQYNQCLRSLLLIRGMEKSIHLNYNRFEQNNVRYLMEFKIDSLSEKFGEVPAKIEFNIIKRNRHEEGLTQLPTSIAFSQMSMDALPPTTVIRIDGIQNCKLFRNLISDNALHYNLVAGLKSARLHNYFYATENWWGSINIADIERRIFDFDRWNDHADVIFQPFLIEDSFDASISLMDQQKEVIDLNNWQGGRISKDMVLRKRDRPYLIFNDITVMPGTTLTIQHGVQMEFNANIGLLVLGSLNAVGYRESPIIMKSFRNDSYPDAYYKVSNKRSLMDMPAIQPQDPIRLCTNIQNCSNAGSTNINNINEGFLEYFNQTTLQWVPICDSRFTERNAQVVCRQLGYNPLTAYYAHDRRIEFHINSLSRIWSWVQPLECSGNERYLSDCVERLNGQVYGHRHECHWDDVFVFVSCTGSPNKKIYWGGIRFANSEFESNHYEQRYHGYQQQNAASRLEFVRIENAGILHYQKSPALQAITKTPSIFAVNIIDSAHHGVNYIAPSGAVQINYLNITNAFGTGINILSLSGEGRESDESSFTPLRHLDLPYKLFSMLDICDPQKSIIVEERILLYYKYDNNPVNCVKTFTSAFRAKPIGFRLLQSHLFNHSKLYGRMDALRLYDGDVYNVTAQLLGQIESDTNNHKQFFKTQGPTLSVHLVASGAPEYHGFIAEIVTVPISTIGQYRDALHNISNSRIKGGIKGALSYFSAGEITPILTLVSNRLENNCQQLFGNFSTCNAAVNMDVQNMHSFYFMNNLVVNNQGGLRLRADSRGSATSLRGFIHHNLFYKNVNRPTLFIEGRQSSPYQEVEIYRNYFAQNLAGYDDVIRLRQVVSNFSHNYIHYNVGNRIMEVSGFEKVRLPIYQTTAHNGFYSNIATTWMDRGTIVAGTAGQQYVDNIFENPDNDYEIITVNSSSLSFDSRNSTIELWRSKIDARHNYWSYNNSISVLSRIKDKSDDPLLLEVEAIPFQMNNRSILDGKCPPGWSLIHDTCYTYIGVPMSFHEAKAFCRSENSSMPFLRTDSMTLFAYLQTQMGHLRYPEKVWIQDINYIDRCTSFAYAEIIADDCQNEFGFICEIDPQVSINPLSWRADIFAISIISSFVLVVMLLLLVAICWYAKSKHRQNQRLQRRNSIRQSLRSLNSIEPQGSLRRRTFHMSSSSGTLTKTMTQDYKIMGANGSFESIDKSVLTSEASFEPYDNLRQHDKHEYLVPQKINNNEYVTNGTSVPRLATIGSASKASASRGRAVIAAWSAVQPPNDFELSFRNEGFRDNSTYSGTRNNSIITGITEDTPIIHQTDIEENSSISDYYGNASTLPLRHDPNENLAFLSELKRNLPDAENTKSFSDHAATTFLPKRKNISKNHVDPSIYTSQNSNTDSLTYEQKIDNLNFSSLAELRMSNQNQLTAADIRRPDSYLTAVGSNRLSRPAPLLEDNGKLNYQPFTASTNNGRPKTVYENGDTLHLANDDNRTSHQRSRSEALLETDLDYDQTMSINISGRCYSQPLETSM